MSILNKKSLQTINENHDKLKDIKSEVQQLQLEIRSGLSVHQDNLKSIQDDFNTQRKECLQDHF